MSTPTDKCRSCKAPILWLVNTSTQRAAPIDAEPSPAGNILVLDERTYRVLRPVELGNPEIGQGRRHTSHFQTCPDAAKFKRKSS